MRVYIFLYIDIYLLIRYILYVCVYTNTVCVCIHILYIHILQISIYCIYLNKKPSKDPKSVVNLRFLLDIKRFRYENITDCQLL